MAPPSELDTITNTADRLFGWLGVAIGFLLVAWRRLTDACHAVRVAHELRATFGDEAGHTIKQLIETVSRASSEQQIRQRIAERHLELGIYVCGPDAKCTYANDYLSERFGRDSAKMQGWGWLGSVAAEDTERVRKDWLAAVEYGLPYATQYTVENAITEERWKAQTEAFAVVQGSEVICYVGYVIEDKINA